LEKTKRILFLESVVNVKKSLFERDIKKLIKIRVLCKYETIKKNKERIFFNNLRV